jgi:hypothetical protein
MLRRQVNIVSRSVGASAAACASLRFSVDTSKKYDHSASFSRPLNESEATDLERMRNRTVSAIVPGKLFMRHWIAGEQATVSIYNRALSLMVTFGLIAWAGTYSTFGFSTESSLIAEAFVFLTIFLVVHTHMNELYAVCLGAYLFALALGY